MSRDYKEYDTDRDSKQTNRDNTASYNRTVRSFNTKSDESKRNTKWVSYTKSRVSFGFQHLSPAYVPTMGSEKRGFAICLEKISGWSIPVQVLKEFGKGDYEITAQLSLSMYHLNSSSFYGSTWMGPSISLGSSGTKIPKVVDFEYSDIVYMVSRITDPSCVGVIEVVVSKFDTARGLVASQFGCGWTMLNLFTRPLPPDVDDGFEEVPLTSCAMFSGSPRDLIMSSDMKVLTDKLSEIPDCSLFFRLCSHRKLLRAQHLVSENECIGRFDVVAGLVARPVIPPGTVSSALRRVACIGDEERFDDKVGNFCVPARPIPALTATVKIANFQLFVPHRLSADIKLLEAATVAAGGRKMRILSRRLQIGLHNGHSVVGGSWQTHQLVEDDRDRDILLTSEAVLALGGFVPNEFMALVMHVQVDLGAPRDAASRSNVHVDSAAMVRATDPLSKDAQVTTVSLGTAIFIPSDGRVISLRNTADSPLSGGDDHSGVDIELALLKDELGAVLSPSVFLQDADGSPASGAVGGPNEETKGRLSLVADKKSAGRGPDSKAMRQDDFGAAASPMVGFDVKVLHPVAGELRHGDDVSSLVEMRDSGKTTGPAAHYDPRRHADAKSDRDSREGPASDEDTKAGDLLGGPTDRSHRFSRSTAKVSGFTGRTFGADDFGDLDEADNVSVAESIVTGDSERSAYRLDPAYYSRNIGPAGPGYARGEEAAPPRHNRPSAAEPTSGAQSLLGRSLQVRLKPDGRPQAPAPAPHQGELLLHNPHHAAAAFGAEHMRVAPRTVAGADRNEAHVRELSRGARSRLSRHGFQGAISDSAVPVVHGQRPSVRDGGMRRAAVDVELEARDPLSLHEISLQFAGFRAGAHAVNHAAGGPEVSHGYCPKSVFCSFQFYTCMSTKTEVMRLIAARAGEPCVFVRDDPLARNETPLSLRFLVDVSASSPLEAVEFAEYLAHCALYVDLWDADSLLLIGTFAVPLRKLLRQGRDAVRHVVECDVVSAEAGEGPAAVGGISSCVVADGGPVAGAVVGAVQVIMSNYGQKGARSGSALQSALGDKENRQDFEDLNWRAHGVERTREGVTSSKHRPKNSIRARPLSESTPQLGDALQRVRDGSASDHKASASSMRSLTAERGGGGLCTLTYDEISVVFKRFQGRAKGSVQYSGDLMALLDLPSWAVALRRLLEAYRRFGDRSAVERELDRHSGAQNQLGVRDIEEFLRVLFDRSGVGCRPEDLTLIAGRFVAEGHGGVATRAQIVSFCESELDRQHWTLASRRLRLAAESAYLAGEDVQQRLCEKDAAGNHCISSAQFREVLAWLSGYGNLSHDDRALACRHFSRQAVSGADEGSPQISLREVMAFLGKDYVGNIQARVQRSVRTGSATPGPPTAEGVLALLRKHAQLQGKPTQQRGLPNVSYEVAEAVLGELGVFGELTHEQVRAALRSIDLRGAGVLSCKQLLSFLGVDFSARDLEGGPDGAVREGDAGTAEPQPLNVEGMLRILLDKTRANGMAVDEAFRHFDSNGDGSISVQELERGLEELCIFGNIPGWREQIPELVRQFDTSGDGEVSLREFFKYLGIAAEYAPNVVQKMTRIFAVATQKGLTVAGIFAELDSDGSGALDAKELLEGLRKIGTFGELTQEDAQAVVAQFDSDGDRKVSTDEFVRFFAERVQRAVQERRRRLADKKPVVKQFRAVMSAARAKGVTAKDLFGHIDRDKGGSISAQEFAAVLSGLPHFKTLPRAALEEVFSVLDTDGSGDVSLAEFERFLDGDGGASSKAVVGVTKVVGSLADQVREVFSAAKAKGLSFQRAFSLADADGNGQLSLGEFEKTLRRLPSFQGVERGQVKAVFDAVDRDGSGLITVAEFRAFASGGGGRTEEERKGESPSRDTSEALRASAAMGEEEFRAAFVRTVNRLVADDSAFLARLDDDGDGLVERSALHRALARADVFRTLHEEKVEALLTPFVVQRDFVAVDALTSFLEGRAPPSRSKHPHHDESKHGGQEGVSALSGGGGGDGGGPLKEYSFSPNPEVCALEKKMRAFGKVLARKGVDVEALFRRHDKLATGSVRRTEFVEVLSAMGMHLLEQGRAFDSALHPEDDTRHSQMMQISKLKGGGAHHLHSAPRLARRALLGSDATAADGFSDHLESMSLVNSYRNSQKQMLLQRVLAFNLQKTVRLYPRFGTALFFEWPLTNPFGHEERFEIEVGDPELRLVTAFDEWMHLRTHCRPCVGELGSEPVEAEMFDQDASGRVQVVLLPFETLSIPFTFLTLIPLVPEVRVGLACRRRAAESKSSEQKQDGGGSEAEADEAPRRSIEVRVVSGTHGHVVSVLRALIHPRPFVLHRTLRFFEPENSVMKRRVVLAGHENMSVYPGEFTAAARYVHCVESAGGAGGGHSRVVVEWGPSGERFGGMGSLDMLIRYRCGAFPDSGAFYLLIFNDPYQSCLHEVWQVVVQSRQRLDVHGSVGAVVNNDLVVRGDRFARRVRAFASATSDAVSFRPESVFQLVPGAYNRVALALVPKQVGVRRVQVSLVDVDSRELVSAWVLVVSATGPDVLRTYDLQVPAARPTHKKITFTNHWDVPRRFALSSSDESIMRPRNPVVDVPARGHALLRLWFSGGASHDTREVHLFLNDHQGGQAEECYLFRVSTADGDVF